MKRIFTFTFLFIIVLLVSSLQAQVTNLNVNGQSGSFIISQDIGVTWECDIPAGQSAQFKILMHINGGTFIDPATDKNLFGTGTQTDGDASGNNGPPDMDGAVNGHLTFTTNTIMLAPGSYTFVFINNTITTSISGTVLPMAAPPYTIAGKFTPGSGQNAKNILVRAMVKNSNMMQSYGMTDASGNYVINIGSYAAGLTETVSIQDNIQPYVASPQDTSVVMSKSWTGINFISINPAAKLVGFLKTESGAGIASTPIRCYAYNQSDVRKEVYTDVNGMYSFGFTTSELNSYSIWQLLVNSQLAPTYVTPITGNISMHAGDSLRVDLLAYTANATITGRVYIDGKGAVGKNFSVVAYVQDTVSAWSPCNISTGEFTLYVTSKISKYTVGVTDLGDSYAFKWSSAIQYSPGATGVSLNVVTVAWNSQTSPTSNDLNAVVFPSAAIGYAVGNGGTILKTINAGTTWNTLASNSTADLKTLCFINETTGWVGGTTGTIKKTTDGGATWIAENSGISYPINALQFTDANNGWALDVDNFLRTTNGGTTWSAITAGPTEGYLWISMVNATTGFICTTFGNVYKTTDGGTSWSMTSSVGGYNTKIRFANATTGYLCGNGDQILVTTDGGVTWNGKSLESNPINDIFVVDATTAFAVGYSNAIFKTTDAGATWNQQLLNQNNNYCDFYSVAFSDANNGWAVGTSGKIFHTTTGGTVDVHDALAGKAEAFTLSQNYPNPFNPTTVIDYLVPQNADAMKHVSLKVYNMLGQEVAVLVDKELSAGSYKAFFNGHNLASGIYLYTLQVGEQSVTKKMILLK